MKKRKFGYEDGGEVTYGEDERPAPTGMGEIAEGMRTKPKSFKEAKNRGGKTLCGPRVRPCSM